MERDNPDYAIGERVVVKVEKLFPFGIFVRLVDGTPGYIRRRELSWSGDREIIVHEGQTLETVVLQLPDAEHMIELSLKATLPDPWEEFISMYRKDDVVEGTVKHLQPFGVFIEILPGVQGLIPLNHLAPWKITKAEDVVWMGDHVEAIITRIERKTRKVWLSICSHMQQDFSQSLSIENSQASSAVPTYPSEEALLITKNQPRASGVQEHTVLEGDYLRERQAVGRILIVDDRAEFREPLVTFMRHRGYEAEAVQSPAEAIEKTAQHVYQVLLVDIDLPEMSGLDLIRILKERGVDAVIAVMSVPEWLRSRAKEIEDLDVVEVFAKPLDLDEVERLLIRVGRDMHIAPWRESPTEDQPVIPVSSGRFVMTPQDGLSLAERLHKGLQRLVEDIRAETGIIFSLDTSAQTLSIMAHVGSSKLAKNAMYSLEESPVKDVARSRRSVLEHRMSAHRQVQRRFQKLLALLPFESCIGVPIEVHGEVQYVLFVFHRDQDAFNHYRLRDTEAAANLFSAIIERDRVGQRLQSFNKFLLSGELAAGFGHEVRNQISSLEIQLLNLQTDCRLLNQQSVELAESSGFREIQASVDSLLSTTEKLNSTIELFQGLMLEERHGLLDVNQIVRNVEILLRPVARVSKVQMKTMLHPDLPLTAGQGVRLQQVLFNIMLNAIQHMATKSQAKRILHVSTFCGASSEELPIKIRFSDTGPGIHRQLWDKIFTLGFSTRTNGTGLGLFIARSLVESLGGNISVERSVVPIGTTFLVALPFVTPQE